MEEKNYIENSEIIEETENKEIVENNEIVEEGANNIEPEFETFNVTVEGNDNNIEVQNTTTVVIEPEVEELPEVEEDEVDEDSNIPATLKGCTKLNVRKEASKESEVVCVVTTDCDIAVSMENSTEDFYKIHTVMNGVLVEGYCMKQFINIE